MPTDNPKISGYVPQQIYDRFKEYQQKNQLTMSQAVIVIFAEYFGLEETIKETTSGLPVGGVTLSAFEELQKEFLELKSRVDLLESTSKLLKESPKVSTDKNSSSQLSLLSKPLSKIPRLLAKDLGKRLGVDRSTVNRNKNSKTKDDFIDWTYQKDPDSIKWTFDKEGSKVFYSPMDDLSSELVGRLLEWITDNIPNAMEN